MKTVGDSLRETFRWQTDVHRLIWYSGDMLKFLQKWFFGWIGVYMASAKNRRHFIVDYVMSFFLRIKKDQELSSTFFDQYSVSLKQTKYWHGTGWAQYDADGKVQPTFKKILLDGGLSPNHDVFDVSTGEMSSISCTSIRVYARIYADMHNYNGVKRNSRLGEPFMWGYYFIVSSALLAVYHMRLWTNAKKRHIIEDSVKANMKDIWINKVSHRKYISMKDFFVRGTDIPDNFGVLIGLKNIHRSIETSPYISMYETRIGKMIPTNMWSHLEVPRDYIDKMTNILTQAGIEIPIYAIEDCERYWSRMSFSFLAS